MAAGDPNSVDYGGCIFYDENSGSVVNMPERQSAEKKVKNLPTDDETAIRLLIHFKVFKILIRNHLIYLLHVFYVWPRRRITMRIILLFIACRCCDWKWWIEY